MAHGTYDSELSWPTVQLFVKGSKVTTDPNPEDTLLSDLFERGQKMAEVSAEIKGFWMTRAANRITQKPEGGYLDDEESLRVIGRMYGLSDDDMNYDRSGT